MDAPKITKITARPIPTADSSFVDTPMNGHIPKNFVRIILLISNPLIKSVNKFII